MRDAFFAVLWLALLPVCLMSASAGILLWIWVALLSPGESLYGMLAGVPFNKLVAIVTIGTTFVSREKKDFYFDTTQTLLCAFALLATVSWLSSLVPTDSGTELYLKLIKEIVLALLLSYVMITRHRIHLVILIVVLSIGFYSVREGLEFAASGGGHKILGVGSIGDNNSLATAMLMVTPMLFYLYRYSDIKLIRLGFLGALVLSVIATVGTFSRGGFIGMVVLALFQIKNSKNKFAMILLVAATAGLVFALAPESWFHRLDTIGNADNDSSFMGRVVAWKMSLLIALDHPWLGGGPHAVQQLLTWETYRPFLPFVDFVTTPTADIHPHAAHSIWFEVLGDYGFTGLLLFISLLGVGFWNCWRITRLARGSPSLGWATDLARMLQITLACYVVTGSALSMGYFELLYIVLALLSRTRRTVMQTLAQEQREASTAGSASPGYRVPGRPQPAFARLQGR